MKTPDHLYECLLRVRNSPDMAPLREWLVAKREDMRDRMESLHEQVPMFRAQGAAIVLKDLIDLIEESPRLLDKGRTPVRRPEF